MWTQKIKNPLNNPKNQKSPKSKILEISYKIV